MEIKLISLPSLQLEVYRKKQLEGNLSPAEEKELMKLEGKNIKTIEEVYNALKNDTSPQPIHTPWCQSLNFKFCK